MDRHGTHNSTSRAGGFERWRRCFRLLLAAGLLVGAAGAFAPAAWASGYQRPVYTDVPLPHSFELCGERMPLDNLRVREMLDRELIISVMDPAQVIMWLKRTGRYFPYIERRLKEERMPGDLKYLAVAESALIPYIRSPAGARGPWQFMAFTARRHGLRKDRSVDERLSFEHATEAALAYLKDLHDRFHSWMLALAAYNCGEARVEREMRIQKVTSYYRLNLPIETERFVYRIAAVKIVLENPQRYGFFLPRENRYAPIAHDTIQLTVTYPVHFTDLAKAIGTDYKVLKELNLQFRQRHLPIGTYTLKVPPGKSRRALAAVQTLCRRAEAAGGRYAGDHIVVKRGDTLSAIAQKTGVSVSTLKRLNGIRGSKILVGQRLRLR